MLAIKLQRIGKKHQPSYRFVVAEKRSKMIAPPVEDIGSYNPFTKTAIVNKERVLHWIKMGAQPTVSVHNLLVAQGVVTAPVIKVKMKKAVVAQPEAAAPVTTEAVTETAVAEEIVAPAAEEAKAEEVAPESAPAA